MDVDVKEGNRVDVQHDGIGHVELGADVTYGQALSSDAEGRGIPAEGASGIVALDSGSEGDVVRIKVDCAGSAATASAGDETPSEHTELETSGTEGGETPTEPTEPENPNEGA